MNFSISYLLWIKLVAPPPSGRPTTYPGTFQIMLLHSYPPLSLFRKARQKCSEPGHVRDQKHPNKKHGEHG